MCDDSRNVQVIFHEVLQLLPVLPVVMFQQVLQLCCVKAASRVVAGAKMSCYGTQPLSGIFHGLSLQTGSSGDDGLCALINKT